MSHFDFLNNGAKNMFGDSSVRRKRRLQKVAKNLARKMLDRYVIEKMEDRWLPAVNVLEVGSQLQITLDAANDQVLLKRTGGTSSDNINITASSSIVGNTSVSGITSILVLDSSGSLANQQLIFQDGSVGNFVSTIQSNSIEVINISTKLNGSLSVIGSGTQIEGSVSGSTASQVSVTNSTLTILAPQVNFTTLTSTNSTLNLSVAFLASNVTATDSAVSISNTVAPDFSGTALTLNGGSLTVIKDSRLNSLVLNGGLTAPSANFASSTNLTSITQNCGTLVFEGNVQNITLNGGSLTIRRTPGTVVGVVDNPKVSSFFNINGGTAIVQDDANISGLMNVNGTSTSLTIQAGANYSPVVSSVNVNNGTVTISNTTLTDNSDFTVYDGTVSLTDVDFYGDVSVLDGTVNIVDGSFSGGIGVVGGVIDINGAILRNNLNTVVPVLSITSGTVSVFNTTLDASPNSNTVYVGAVSTAVNLGNASTPGNNTFNITSAGTPLFIENKSLQPVYALGNSWNYNGTNYSSTTQPTSIANYLFGASNSNYLTSTAYGVVYFNGSNIYVLNDQQVFGVNSIWGAAFSAAPGDTVYVYGGSNSYNETIELFKTLDIIGVANGTGVNPVLKPVGVPASFGYFTLCIDYSNPQFNVISNMTFDGSGLSPVQANTTRIIDQQYFNNSTSCLTLNGNISMVGFNPLNNPEMIVVSGGELVIDSSNILETSILVSASGIGASLQINAGKTVNGTLSVNPSADPISVNIAGTLNGYSNNTINLQCGTIDLTGLITASEVFIDGAVVNVTNGSISSLTQIQSGNLNISGSSILSGSLNILGGNTNITGGTFTANTASNPSAVNAVLAVSGGDLQMSGGLILATENGSAFRDGLLIDGSQPGYLGSDVILTNVNITLSSSNNNLTSGIRVLGADSVLSGQSASNVTFGDGLQINGGNYSISLGGVNTFVNANQFGNITLNAPDVGYITLSDYAYFNDQTNVMSYLDASQVIFKGGSLASGGYQPSTTAFSTSNLTSLFEIESKISDYTTGSSVGFISLYSDRNFAISGREIQRSINPLSTNEYVYVQEGNFSESLNIDSSKSGLSLIGPLGYGCSTPANLYPVDGSISAILVEANDVQIRGMSISGMNGTTNLLANGQLSGTNFGITNFNGTLATSIANLTVANNVISHFVNSGVLLSNNTGLAPSTIANNSFSSIGIDGFNGGVILSNNAYALVTDNLLSGVTNGIVLKDFTSVRSSGSSDITRNTISAYSTGLTVTNMSGTSSSFTVGDGSDTNSFSLASGMNTTIAGPGLNETIGIYLQNISSSSIPNVKDNNISGFAYGYDISDVSQTITITGGSVYNATVAAFAVLKNQSFDPNTVAPGIGTSNLDVNVSRMTVNGYSSAIGFLVDGDSIPSSAQLSLTGYSEFVAGNTQSSTGALSLSGGVLNLLAVTFDDNTYHNATYGVLNNNATVNINDGLNITGFTSAMTQNGSIAQSVMSGGLVSGLFTGGEGLLIQEGSLVITGGKVEMDQYAIKTLNANTIVSIDSTSGNISLSSDNYTSILSLSSNQITISQSGSDTTNVTSNGTSIIDSSVQGNLIITGGTFQNTNPNGNGILYNSSGTLDISGGLILGNVSGAGTGITVSLGSSNITGGNVSSGFDTGVSFTSSSGILSINNTTSTTLIGGNQTGIEITAGSAIISNSNVFSNYTGISFSSPGQLTVSGSSSEITSTLGNSILVSNGTANISDALVNGTSIGINFDGPNANGSISNTTFSGLGSDLQLNRSGYGLGGGVTIGGDNSFSGSSSNFGFILNKTAQSYLLPPTTSFNGVPLSLLSVPANLTSLFSVQDKIVDQLDNSNFGLVRLKPADLFITTSSYYAPNTEASIQRAINSASISDTIYVQNGTYADESVNVNKTVSIYGGGSSGTLLNNETWTVGSPSVTISGFTFTGNGSGTAILASHSPANSANLTLSDLTIEDYGTGLGSTSSVDLSNLTLTHSSFNNLSTGVEVNGNFTDASINNVTFNNMSNTDIALLMSSPSGSLTVTNSCFTGTGVGLTANGSALTTLDLQNVTLSGSANSLDILTPVTNLSFTSVGFNKSGTGLSIGSGSGVTNLTVQESNFTGNANAIDLNANISVVCVTNSTLQNSGTGVYVGSSMSIANMLLSNVVFSGSGDALDLFSPVGNLTVTAVGFNKTGIGLSVGVGSGVTNLKLQGSNFTGNTNAVDILSPVSNVNVTNTSFRSSGNGIFVNSSGSINGLIITGSSFANSTNGILAVSNTSVVNNESRLTNISITNSTFSNNTGWGIDTQMLNDTLISNVSFSNNGNTTINSGGIRLNLSNGTFSNITITDSCLTDNGIAGNVTNPGSAIKIEVAPDGTLTTLSLNNLTIDGNGTSSTGLVGLNLSGNLTLASTSISNVSISGANSTGILLSGSPNGSSLVLNNATFATSLETYIRNETSGVTIDATNATFAGVNSGASLGVDDAYLISDKLVDGVDRAGWGPVVIKSGNTYVTPSSYLSSNSLTPSIQRAIDLTSGAGTLWIQGNSAAANYTGGFDTSTSNLTVQTGNETQASIVNIEGNMVLSNTTTIPVRVGGTSNGSYTQFNLVDANATSVNYANAIIEYSNISGFVPTTGEQFRIINLLNSASPGSSTLQANVVGSGFTILQNESRYQLAPSQYFATLYGVNADRNDFVLVSVPQSVLNVVVWDSWSTNYFGDQVTYVDSTGNITLLTYGVDAASNITRGIGQIEAPSATATLSVANGTYSQGLGVYSNGTVYTNNLSINLIGTNATSVPDAQVIGNITVDSIDLNQNTSLNYRVIGSSGATAVDQINTNGSISLGNAIANIAFSGSFANTPLVKNSVLTLLNNTNSTAISGQFQYNNGTGISTLSTGTFLSVPGNSTNGFYSTYKFGTAPVFNDFSLIWNSSAGNITPVQVDDDWAAYDFGALVTVGSDNYVVGIDAYAEMKSYSPTGLPGVTLQGAVAAVTPTGSVTIANGTYNGTFTVNKPFSLTGPSTGNATFPASTGQTVLGQSGSDSANVTSTNWTNNLRFGNILVENGTVFDNVASLIETDGTLNFESGVTFSNVSLDVTRSMTIRSNQTGIVSVLQTGLAGTGISASGSNVNLTLTDLSITGSNIGVNLTNTGSVLFSNTTINVSSNAPGTIDGPTILTLNYADSTGNNNLILSSNSLNFSPFGSSNLTIGGLSNLTLNANLGTSSGSAGNNTINLGVNSTLAGGVIATGSGVDAFTISAPQPLTIQAGAGNDTLSLPVAGSYLGLFDGGAGVNTLRTGPNSINYIDIDGVDSGSIYLTRGNTTTRSQFANIDRLFGNAYTDIFSFTSTNSSISSINGGNGNDQLNFSGTSGANTSFTYSQQLEANITGSSSGSVNYFNFSNSTARVSVTDSFISVENIVGGSGDDIIRMQSGGTLAGSFNGGLGNNTLDYSSFPIGIKADLTKGSVTGIGGSSAYRVSNVRDVYGSAFNDILLGDSGNNILVGNDGNDSIVGNAGNDLLIGGIGADTLRGGAGGNIQIGGYVNFDQGGTSTAYGVPSQYVDFVLRSMMNVWSSVTDGTTFDTQAANLETTGVSVQVPGNTTSYSSIRLFSAANLTDTIKGSVFDDGQADTLDLALSTLNWIFVPPFGDTIVGGSPRKVTYLYKLIP